MSSSAKPSLPNEIWYLIIGILSEPSATNDRKEGASLPSQSQIPYSTELRALSSTCKWLRHLLAPRLFQRIWLYNSVKSASSVKAISEGDMAGQVKELRYIGSRVEDREVLTLQDVYPPQLNHVLSNLAAFPNLERLHVSFPFNGVDLTYLTFEFGNDAFVDDAKEAAAEELTTAWRGLMAASYRAIASNYQSDGSANEVVHLPRCLEIEDLPLVMISTFDEPMFHHFLSQLTSFTLTLPYLDNGAGWHITTQEIYYGFTDCLNFWFFDHLKSVEHFSFDPDETGILGSRDSHSFVIGLFQAAMPKLRTLKLSNVFICNELLDFCLRHINTLERIFLHDCAAEDGSLRWQQFFNDIELASPPCLKELDVVYKGDNDKEEILDFDSHWADTEQVERAKRKIQEEPNARAFPYASLDDKYGFRREHGHTAIEFFLEGGDDRAYTSLLNLMNRNNSP